jgi:hypothetical protein
MFCPLCKAEYRLGFLECSDCHIALVSSEAEAVSIGAARLWEGDDRGKYGRILDVLKSAGIPFHSKELLKRQPWSWFSILLFQFVRPRPTFHLEVWVLRPDFGRAQSLLRDLDQRDAEEERELMT